jgi:cardiolipin synthase
MIHTKTIVVDGIFSMSGTSNFDSRSTQINEELDITIYDEGFGAEMNGVFERDLQVSKPYRLEDFEKRPVGERVSEWLVAPLAPLL